MLARNAFSARTISTGCPALRRKLWGIGAAHALHVTPAAQYRDAMPAEAQELLQADGYKYLDVRTPEEFSAGHVPSAVNAPVVFLGGMGMSPNPTFVSDVEKAFPDKAQSLVVGCKSGRRSLMAIDVLSQAGYCNLVNLVGGFDLWASQGLPVSK